MGVYKKVIKTPEELKDSKRDVDKMYYLYWQRMFSIEEIEHYFNGKYTYKEVRDIIRNKRKEYYEQEEKNGRL